MSDSTVIILGASTRAAATSARRAGWTPWCADLYADADLERIATVRKVSAERYPKGLLDALAHAPPGPVIYTGALENHPGLIARIDRPLWGNAADVLKAIRSPLRWAQCLQARGLPCPTFAEEPRSDGRWLLKPRRSAGGLAIRFHAGEPFNRRSHFLQEWIEGIPHAALYLGRDDDATLLGVTQQLVGTPWLNATGFHYAGNVGPLPIVGEAWQQLGSALARTFPLRGLFGVDAIVRDGVPWPVEVNPRYTASVEVYERCWKTSLFPWHRDAFAACGVAFAGRPASAKPQAAGKAILYARETFAFPERGPWCASLEDGVDLDQTEYADIPHAGEIIERGRPVLTLFATAATAADCLASLQEKAQALDRRLWG